jgi:hypothetical protein
MSVYPLAEVTGEIKSVKVRKGGTDYTPGTSLVFDADGSSFTLLVTVVYHGPQTSGGRVYGLVYPPSGGYQWDEDGDMWPYDVPDTQYTYTIDFGPINIGGTWTANISYTRTPSGQQEKVLATWSGTIFKARQATPLFSDIKVLSFAKV